MTINISDEYKKLLDEIHELGDRHTQEIKNYIWDKYTVDGLSPIFIRKACEDVLSRIEKREIKEIEQHGTEDDKIEFAQRSKN